MRNFVRFYIIAAFVLVVAPTSAQAQVPVATFSQSLVNEYIGDTNTPRRASWWNLLGRQLTVTIDKDFNQVSENELINVIYFATHHTNKVHLDDAVPSLLNIVEHHNEDGYRIMALSALHAIGDAESINRVELLYAAEPKGRVKKTMRAVVADYRK